MSVESEECFICHETYAPLTRFCKCRNTLGHRHCMLKTIQSVSSHRSACPACKTPYDMSTEKITFFRFHCHHILILDAASVTAVVLMGLSLEPIWIEHSMRHVVSGIVFTTIALLSIGLSTKIRCANGILFPFSKVTFDKVNLNSRPATPDAIEMNASIVQCV